MKHILFLGLLISISFSNFAQGGWSWTQLPDMPNSVSNNVVASATINDTTYVYSFFGIDSTKTWSGIHSKVFRYNTITQIWDTLPSVQDSLGGLVAAGASTIKNKIYLIGGYHVYSNSNEISSYETIIFDPTTNSYSRGKNIPVEIDDHVQITYKDSLIYVISGWTSSLGGGNNTNKVQVYDAINDEWYLANDMPNTSTFKIFGASGSIVNDTIYFAGGARYATNFPLVSQLRKGIIDPNNALDVNWSVDTTFPSFKPYRSASVNIENKVFWLGGSSVSYNYDGIAYNGSGGVTPSNFITEYNNSTNKWEQYANTPFQIMDLRGLTKVDDYSFIIAGGMGLNQVVSRNTFLVAYDSTFASSTDTVDIVVDTITSLKTDNSLIIEKNNYFYNVKNVDVESIMVYDLFGRAIKKSNSASISMLGERGVYTLQVTLKNGYLLRDKILIK